MGPDAAAPPAGRRAIAIGKFDALHRGHQAAAAAAGAFGDGVLLSFSGLAQALGWPLRLPLVAPSERAGILAGWSRSLGCRLSAQLVPFASIRSMAPLDFLRYLRDHAGAQALVVGSDFRFGQDRAGDVDLLARACPDFGLALQVVPPLQSAQASISSSRVRSALAAGAMEEVQDLLGRPYRLVGEVVHGDGRGRSLGFPTANCGKRENQEPAVGVYAAWAMLSAPAAAALSDGQGAGEHPALRLPAVVNVGFAPTIAGVRDLTVEAHLLAGGRNCYGMRLALDVVSRLRGEQRFASLEALRQQIASDAAEAARRLAAID